MNKAIKYRIYPNSDQKVLLEKTFGCCRFIWNQMLSDKQEYYKKHKKSKIFTPAMYKDANPWLKEVDSLALANVQMHLETAYKSFFKKKSKYPKFKSKHKSRKSYTTNYVNNNIKIIDKDIFYEAAVSSISDAEYIEEENCFKFKTDFGKININMDHSSITLENNDETRYNTLPKEDILFVKDNLIDYLNNRYGMSLNQSNFYKKIRNELPEIIESEKELKEER